MLIEARAVLMNPPRALRIGCILLAVLTTVNLFYLGAKPFAAGLFPEPWDKLAHLVVFGAISTLLWIGASSRVPAWAIVLVVAAIGALDELHQATLPGRNADIYDFITDVIAAMVALVALHFLRGSYVRNSQRRIHP